MRSPLSVELVLHKQPLSSNYLSSSGRDLRPPRTWHVSSFLISLFSLHVSRFQTVSPSPLSRWEEEEESFDMRIVRVGGGSSPLNRIRSRLIHHKYLARSLLLESYNSSRSVVFLISQTRASPLLQHIHVRL
jgi:hypothetical protein